MFVCWKDVHVISYVISLFRTFRAHCVQKHSQPLSLERFQKVGTNIRTNLTLIIYTALLTLTLHLVDSNKQE